MRKGNLRAAGLAIAQQYMHDAIRKTFSGLQTPRLRPGESGVQVTVSNSPPPPIGSLMSYVEEQVRRTITCDASWACRTSFLQAASVASTSQNIPFCI